MISCGATGWRGCDYWVPDPGFIVEFDESQHFTIPRKLALAEYADEEHLGFSAKRWITLCEHHDSKDNDPPFRDEQRAWYDTLRDVLPSIKGLGPTVRLYAGDRVWCSLDPDSEEDRGRFLGLDASEASSVSSNSGRYTLLRCSRETEDAGGNGVSRSETQSEERRSTNWRGSSAAEGANGGSIRRRSSRLRTLSRRVYLRVRRRTKEVSSESRVGTRRTVVGGRNRQESRRLQTAPGRCFFALNRMEPPHPGYMSNTRLRRRSLLSDRVGSRVKRSPPLI